MVCHFFPDGFISRSSHLFTCMPLFSSLYCLQWSDGYTTTLSSDISWVNVEQIQLNLGVFFFDVAGRCWTRCWRASTQVATLRSRLCTACCRRTQIWLIDARTRCPVRARRHAFSISLHSSSIRRRRQSKLLSCFYRSPGLHYCLYSFYFDNTTI